MQREVWRFPPPQQYSSATLFSATLHLATMSTLTVSSPQTPPLSEFPEYNILSAIGRASHMGLFGGLSRAPAIGSLGWYMNMRDSGLSDDEIKQIEEGTYNTSSDEDDTSSDHIAVTIAPPPPPLIRVKGFHNAFFDDDDGDDGEDETVTRNIISEFNAVSWDCPRSESPPSPSSTDSSYTTSSQTTYENSSVVEGTLRRVLNAAIDEWNIKIDDCHPSDHITVEELQIRNLKMQRYRHLISNALTLLTDTFGCHICRDRRTYRGACANCLEQKMKGPTPPQDHILPIKLKNH